MQSKAFIEFKDFLLHQSSMKPNRLDPFVISNRAYSNLGRTKLAKVLLRFIATSYNDSSITMNYSYIVDGCEYTVEASLSQWNGVMSLTIEKDSEYVIDARDISITDKEIIDIEEYIEQIIYDSLFIAMDIVTELVKEYRIEYSLDDNVVIETKKKISNTIKDLYNKYNIALFVDIKHETIGNINVESLVMDNLTSIVYLKASYATIEKDDKGEDDYKLHEIEIRVGPYSCYYDITINKEPCPVFLVFSLVNNILNTIFSNISKEPIDVFDKHIKDLNNRLEYSEDTDYYHYMMFSLKELTKFKDVDFRGKENILISVNDKGIYAIKNLYIDSLNRRIKFKIINNQLRSHNVIHIDADFIRYTDSEQDIRYIKNDLIYFDNKDRVILFENGNRIFKDHRKSSCTNNDFFEIYYLLERLRLELKFKKEFEEIDELNNVFNMRHKVYRSWIEIYNTNIKSLNLFNGYTSLAEHLYEYSITDKKILDNLHINKLILRPMNSIELDCKFENSHIIFNTTPNESSSIYVKSGDIVSLRVGFKDGEYIQDESRSVTTIKHYIIHDILSHIADYILANPDNLSKYEYTKES